jgi:hypothetical protein
MQREFPNARLIFCQMGPLPLPHPHWFRSVEPATPACSYSIRARLLSRRQAHAPYEPLDRHVRQCSTTFIKQIFLKPVQNLVGPEAFKPPQRFGKCVKFFAIDTADLFNCGYMLVVERSHNIVHLIPLFG